MRKNAPTAYLCENKFEEVESILIREHLIARIISRDEIPELDRPYNQLSQYIGTVIAHECRFRGIGQCIEFCLIDTSYVGALSFRSGVGGVIILTMGCLALSYCTAVSLLSTEPIIEKVGLNIPVALTEQDYLSFERDGRGFPLIREIDENQDHVMLELSRLTCAAVVLHEISHIINGHLHLVELHPELSRNSAVRQALEHDADCYSIVGLNNFTIFLKNRGAAVVEHPVERVLLCSAAAAIGFSSMGRQMIHPDQSWSQVSASHPPEPRRIASILGVGAEILLRMGLPFDESFRMAAELNILIVDAARLAFGHDKVDILTVKNEMDRRVEYLEEISQTWAKIRPILEPLKIGKGLLAPAVAGAASMISPL